MCNINLIISCEVSRIKGQSLKDINRRLVALMSDDDIGS